MLQVLHKFPVIQHVLFGTLMRFVPFNPSATCSAEDKEEVFKKPIAGDA